MLSEHELVYTADDILLIFRVLFVERFDKLGFYQTLFIESLLVLQHLQSTVLFQLVVKHSQDDTK
jgi:hypothetical protein